MKKIVYLFLLLGFAACKSKKITAESKNKFVIEDLARTATGESLKTIYPFANIKEGTDMFEEGTVERPYSILFPDTEDEMIITWKDAARTKIHSIRVEKDGRWKSSTGIAIGTPYNELVELNGGPISFYGFGWDYSGAVDFEGGKLGKSNVRVFLAPENAVSSEFYGDRKIDATAEEIAEMDLKVSGIIYMETE